MFTIFGYEEFDSLPTPKWRVPLSEEQGRELEGMELRAGSISERKSRESFSCP